MIYCNFCENEATGTYLGKNRLMDNLPSCSKHRVKLSDLFNPAKNYYDLARIIEDKLVIKGAGKVGECWLWVAGINNNSNNGRPKLAWWTCPWNPGQVLWPHRIMCEVHHWPHMPLPNRILRDGQAVIDKSVRAMVLHDPIRCNNKRCVNPDHLRWGNHSDNMRDVQIAKNNLYESELALN